MKVGETEFIFKVPMKLKVSEPVFEWMKSWVKLINKNKKNG